ncbi:Cytoplasmic polyadenylation element-binding protein 1 [Clonorchis sinensis]|uniref:Cytoplasmic polyadenylation element-binding protein 1 n=1 Tax=Clonorchis sinensis TaxID=79923 RepID=A0A8T1MC35_CLOSI|nr:Cytoplasmic polyadenylation element-binding protein 1 [Clonorchis sinensis]
MLEENLASVARYVEELTGCAGASKSNSINPSLSRPDNTRISLLQQTKSERTTQLSEDLTSTTVDSFKRVGMGTATQELLTRLLANQFPELVFSASSLPAELKQEHPNWSTESTSSLSRTTLPANHSPRPSASFEHQTELTSLRGSGQTTPMQVSLDETARGPGYQSSGVGTSVDGCVGQTQDVLLERNDRPNRIDSPVKAILNGLQTSTALQQVPLHRREKRLTIGPKATGSSVSFDGVFKESFSRWRSMGYVVASTGWKPVQCDSKSKPSPKGYCYLIFDHESSVTDLIDACVRDPTRGGDYYTISSSRFRSKDVQVIPWVISDSQYTKSGPYRPDTKRTVFIGALHGMITAEALVTIMNDLFGNVIFAALDTDKYKYPIGSGRVAFSSYKSYLKAVTANFVDIRTSKFIKTIQIDPYLEDSLCNGCQHSPGIYFCRDFECFRYFCPACWQLWHNSTGSLFAHKPLRRTFKPIPERQLPSLIKH